MNKVKEKVLTIIGVMTLLLFGVGATFAYFVAQGGSSEQTNINVTTHTTDSLVFEVGKAISVTADQTTFAPGAGNRSDNTFARATLKANSSTNSATDHYYVYLSIDKNEFKYTTDTKTAELILTVNYKDNDGNITPVTSINGLNYVTVREVSGFDITEEKNLITIANNHEITSTGTEVDEWDITLTLVNLDANQTANAGKNFNATLLIQKEESFSGHIISQYKIQGENNLYYHNGTVLATEANSVTGINVGDILDSEDGSYRYAGGDYTIAPEHQETYKRIIKSQSTDTGALIGRVCGTSSPIQGALCTNEIHYFYLTYDENETKTQYATYKDALAKVIEDGYLLETPVKNYVCFGSNEEICPDDNLYRIMGVFNGKAKLIKADYATKESLGTDGEYNSDIFLENLGTYTGKLATVSKYIWNKINMVLSRNETGVINAWSYSELNKTNLNKNFLNSFENEWTDKIAVNSWNQYLASPGRPKLIFENENGIRKLAYSLPPTNSKIGLMYMSEYAYSFDEKDWIMSAQSLPGVTIDSWMYIGFGDLTMTRYGNTSNYVINAVGGFTINNVPAPYNVASIRPTFFLNTNVNYVSGSGTSSDPYRIK